jgi:DNA-binding beta-propeller fold protein YncE
MLNINAASDFGRTDDRRVRKVIEMRQIQNIKDNSRKLTSGLLLLVFLLLPVAAVAESSVWEWRMSLKIEKSGDAMYMPSAVAFDAKAERYYAIDTGRNRLVSFSRNGDLLKVFTANDQLQSPFDMVRLENGQLWVVEKGRNSLTLVDVAAKKIEQHILRDGSRPVFPDRIAAAGGKLYVLDRASGDILRLAQDLSVEQHYGCRDCSAGFVDFVIHKGKILAIEPRDKKIYRFNERGQILDEIQLGDEAGFPVSLDIGSAGFYYVLDRHANSVLAYDESGQFRYRFLATGQSPGKVYFASQLRFDPWGRLCVVDEGNGRIEVYGQ